MIDLIQYTLLITAFIYTIFELNKSFRDDIISVAYRSFVTLSCVIISYYAHTLNYYDYGVQFLVLMVCVFHMIYSLSILTGAKNETCTNTRIGMDSTR